MYIYDWLFKKLDPFQGGHQKTETLAKENGYTVLLSSQFYKYWIQIRLVVAES